ncbi:MAG: hypothetical protein AB1896_04720 [Thermodesulfobacteriota bacterium]
MQTGQKIGWTILMLIPGLIGALGAFEYLGGWVAAIIWIILMFGLCGALWTDKLSKPKVA